MADRSGKQDCGWPSMSDVKKSRKRHGADVFGTKNAKKKYQGDGSCHRSDDRQCCTATLEGDEDTASTSTARERPADMQMSKDFDELYREQEEDMEEDEMEDVLGMVDPPALLSDYDDDSGCEDWKDEEVAASCSTPEHSIDMRELVERLSGIVTREPSAFNADAGDKSRGEDEEMYNNS